jgi:hypothetical protein
MARRDLIWASHGELDFAAFFNRFGEIPNWGAVGNDRGYELVHWTHNYLAEHAEDSIYRILKRW